jgi:hypothetical protein
MKIIFVLTFQFLLTFTNFYSIYGHGDEVHEKHLHFAHPLVGETPSPDTKVRLDYFFADRASLQSGLKENTIRLEVEYAFAPFISIEANFPYTWVSSGNLSHRNFSNTEIGIKIADFSFEDNNLLIGYGFDFSMPTGNDKKEIGSSHLWNIEPGLSAGYKLNKLEIILSASTGIPFNSAANENAENDLSLHSSFLYDFDQKIQGVLEFNSETILNGEEKGNSSVFISPGIKAAPLNSEKLMFGLSAGFPISIEKEFNTEVLFSVFYHL